MRITVTHNFPAVQRQLDAMQAELRDKVTVRAVNRTIEIARTAASKEIRQEFAVSASYVRERLYVRKAALRAARFTIEAELTASGKFRGQRAANVIAFGARQVAKGVSVKIKRKGSRKVITGAFIANKGRTVFVRTGQKRLPIEPVQTIDVPQMFNAKRINAALLKTIDQRFPQVFEREAKFAIDRFNRGWLPGPIQLAGL